MVALQNSSYFNTRRLLLQKKLSVRELVEHSIALAQEDKLNTFREVTADNALKQAELSQQRINNKTAGPLEGLTLAVKDNYCTKGIKTTASSKMLENFLPSYESTVTQRLFSSGAVMIGKANMDEFAMGSSNTNSYFGDVINPWKQRNNNQNLVSGGSSGGSAVAVASKICYGGLGSDTGGSVRLPAAFTGVVGFKPTYGRCSRHGIIAFASSFDQAGIFAHNIMDCSMILESICGFDNKDSTSKNLKEPNLVEVLGESIRGLRIGIPKEYLEGEIALDIRESVQEVCNILSNAGADVRSISLPNTQYALPAYYIIASAEMSSNLARYDGVRYGTRIEEEGASYNEMLSQTRSQCFGQEVKNRIMMGTYVLSASHFGDYFDHAKKVRRVIHDEFKEAFKEIDVMVTPTSKSTAFPISSATDTVGMYDNDIFTIPSSLAGIPALSIPAGIDHKGLPIGIQLIANHFAEDNLCRVAHIIEKAYVAKSTPIL